MLRAKRRMVGIVLKDNALAIRISEACRRYGLEPVWATSLRDLPLSVEKIVSTRHELREAGGAIPVYYLEDYGSIECLVLSLVAPERRGEGGGVVSVAVDPGKRIGAAYFVDGYAVKIISYAGLEDFLNDCSVVVECLGAGRELRFYIGFRPEEVVHGLVSKIKKAYPRARITLVPEEGRQIGPEGYTGDELSALRIYLTAAADEFRAQG